MKRLKRLHIIWVLVLTACGQKGPLFLPEDAKTNQPEKPQSQAESVTPAQQPEQEQ